MTDPARGGVRRDCGKRLARYSGGSFVNRPEMSRSLPLVHLSLLRPLLAGMRERGVDPEPVIAGVGLTEEAIADETATVHVMVIHQFLEHCADAVEDPAFCATIAMRLDPAGWPMIQAALETAESLAQFLSIYVSRANEVASSVSAYLEIRGDQALFGETRGFRPTIRPGQNDAFMAALAVTILRRAMGGHFDPSRVTIVLCEPGALPPDFNRFLVLRGDEMGFRVQFPSEWLARGVDWSESPGSAPHERGERTGSDFLSDFRELLARQVGQGGLSARDAAAMISMSRASLARRLTAEGTTISSELERARLAFARWHLLEGSLSIEEIASAIGYADPSNFTRAFRRIEGVSPSRYRSLNKSESAS